MVILVVTVNILIALINFYLAWRIWKLRLSIAAVTDTLNSVERKIYNIFNPAPKKISVGRVGTSNLRKRYRQLETQLLRLQQVFTLLSFLPKLGRQGFRLNSKKQVRNLEQQRLRRAMSRKP